MDYDQYATMENVIPFSDELIWTLEDFLFKNEKGYDPDTPHDPNRLIRFSFIYYHLKSLKDLDVRIRDEVWYGFVSNCYSQSGHKHPCQIEIPPFEKFEPINRSKLNVLCDISGIRYKYCRRYMSGVVNEEVKCIQELVRNEGYEIFS